MNVTSFDVLTRRVGAREDRRSALKFLAATAFVAGIAAPRPAAAGKKSKNKATKNRALQKCKGQIAPCRAVFETLCVPGDPGFDNCLEDAATCCAFLGGCNAEAAMTCVIDQFVL